ncbi:naringenin-chalcone synthase [Halobacillus fulvus]|nr:naringenin-chalcone synthase [Halobacillus fulvus]
MAYIISTGVKEAEYSYTQEEVSRLVPELFTMKQSEINRLMPIFENSQIERRQFAEKLNWFTLDHGLEERNRTYMEKAVAYAKEAVSSCLHHPSFTVRPNEVDHIFFVSSTGIATPTVDTFIINDLGFNDSIRRTPLFGLGCAGGTSGIARAYEWLKGNPDQTALVVCVELCSLTFQMKDSRVSNFVGSALFGDGASAVLLAGEHSSLLERTSAAVRLDQSSSKMKKESIDVMGWKVVDSGFEVIFNKSIPRLVKSFWGEHMRESLEQKQWEASDLSFIVAHPGGRKVLEAYDNTLGSDKPLLAYSEKVLRSHGNMSSPTVHFVLHEAMKQRQDKGTKSMMTSLGPGFSSEIISLEWA